MVRHEGICPYCYDGFSSVDLIERFIFYVAEYERSVPICNIQ